MNVADAGLASISHLQVGLQDFRGQVADECCDHTPAMSINLLELQNIAELMASSPKSNHLNIFIDMHTTASLYFSSLTCPVKRRQRVGYHRLEIREST